MLKNEPVLHIVAYGLHYENRMLIEQKTQSIGNMRGPHICFSLKESFDFTSTKTQDKTSLMVHVLTYIAFLLLNYGYLLIIILDELSEQIPVLKEPLYFASIP